MTFGRPAPGQRELLVDGRSGLVLEETSFYLSFLDDTSRAVITDIRQFFRSNPRAAKAKFRWIGEVRENGQVETALNSPIHIAGGEADQPKRWPYIILKGISGNLQDLWLGQRHGALVAPNPNYSRFAAVEAATNGENYDEPEQLEVGEVFGGKMDTHVTLEVGSVGPAARIECNRVADVLLHGLFIPIRREWYRKSLNWIPGSGAIGEEQMKGRQGSESEKECTRSVTFGLQVSWEDTFMFLAPTVEEVEIDRTYVTGPLPTVPEP